MSLKATKFKEYHYCGLQECQELVYLKEHVTIKKHKLFVEKELSAQCQQLNL